MIVNLFNSVREAYVTPNSIINDGWDTIAEFLTEHHKCKSKDEMQLFNFWQFNMKGEQRRIYHDFTKQTWNYESGTIRRCKDNAEGVWALMLDYDGKDTIYNVINDLNGIKFVLYTSFRHSTSKHKFRVVIPFENMVTIEKFKSKLHSIANTFTSVDSASFSISQSFYLHCSPSKETAFSYIGVGEFIDIDMFDDTIIEEQPVNTIEQLKTEYTGNTDYYKNIMIDSLATCGGLHYAGESSKYGVLVLVGLCRSAGMNINEYNILCANMAAPESELSHEAVRLSAWYGWTGNKITKEVREEFIKVYGGVSKFGIREDAVTQRISSTKERLMKRMKI